jgi:hypothetical protein
MFSWIFRKRHSKAQDTTKNVIAIHSKLQKSLNFSDANKQAGKQRWTTRINRY